MAREYWTSVKGEPTQHFATLADAKEHARTASAEGCRYLTLVMKRGAQRAIVRYYGGRAC